MVAINTIKMSSEADPEDERRRAILRQQAYADLLAETAQKAGGDKVYGNALGIAKVGGEALAGWFARKADEKERSEQAMANEQLASAIGKAYGGGSDTVSSGETGEASLPPGPAAPSMAGGGARRTMDSGQVQQAGEIYQGLIKRGVPAIVAAGMVGQTGSESSVNPSAVGDGGSSIGLWQHHADRAQALRATAAKAGRPWNDREIQMDHAVAELNGPERGAYDAARAARTPEEAAAILASKFERPQAEALARTLGARQSLARQVYGGAPVSGGGGTPSMAGGSGGGSGLSAQDIQELVRNPRLKSYGLALYNAHVQEIATRQAQAAELAKEQRTQAFEREKIWLTKQPKLTTVKDGETAIDDSGKPVFQGTPQPGGGSFEADMKLRKEYDEQVKRYHNVHDAMGRVAAAVEERVKNPAVRSPASDMSLLYSFMKLQDPETGVREGEYAQGEKAAGIPERLKNAYNKAIDGELLGDKQRDDFVAAAGRLYGVARRTAESTQKRFNDLATSYGIRPERVGFLPPAIEIPKIGAEPPAPAGAGSANMPPGMPPPGAAPPMKTWAHRAQRPDGTIAVSDDGERWFDPKTGQPFENPPPAQSPPGPPPDPRQYQPQGQPSPARSSLPYSGYPVSGVRG